MSPLEILPTARLCIVIPNFYNLFAVPIIESQGRPAIFLYTNVNTENVNGFAATIPTEAMERVRKLGNPQINREEILQLHGSKAN
jgi:hypothetical protein